MIVEPVLEPHRYETFPAEVAILQGLLRKAWARTEHIAGDIVEIGAHRGATTLGLLQAAPYCARYHVIDPWDGTQDGAGEEVYQDFLARLEPVMHWQAPRSSKAHLPPNLTIHRLRSEDAPPPRLPYFVYHDGNHREPDFQKWYDALVPGGVLAIHDVHEPGWPQVRLAAEALGRPWHEYRYAATPAEHAEYGPAVRGLFWKWKP